MIGIIHRYCIRKRFERLFGKPYDATILQSRKAHTTGARQALKAKQDRVHAALAGRERIRLVSR